MAELKNYKNNDFSLTVNNRMHGIELRFEQTLNELQLAELKNAGFKWSKRQQMWYAYQNSKSVEYASKLTDYYANTMSAQELNQEVKKELEKIIEDDHVQNKIPETVSLAPLKIYSVEDIENSIEEITVNELAELIRQRAELDKKIASIKEVIDKNGNKIDVSSEQSKEFVLDMNDIQTEPQSTIVQKTETVKKENEEIELSIDDLETAKKFIPEMEYSTLLNNAAQGEETEYFKQKIKHVAEMGHTLYENKHGNSYNAETKLHDKGFMHYFIGNSDWYICEVDDNNVGFGFAILNGDTQNAEYGYIDLTEITTLTIQGFIQTELDIYNDDSISMEHAIVEKYPELRNELLEESVDLADSFKSENIGTDNKKITDWNTVSRNLFPIEVFQSANNNILTKSSLVNEEQSKEIIHTEQLTSKNDIKSIREQCREILQKPDSKITEDDKKILSQYEGAGGLNEENRTNAGILNEFYTPNNLVEKVWQIVDSYAPNAKTVLEPSAGVGKFANNRPENEFTMHELDETSARINKILHPEANVIQGAFQKQFFDDGERFIKIGYEQPKYDVVIGNPPYGTYNNKYKGLGEGKEFDRYEEYFISRGLDALKDENSLMAFVVPSGFLNSSNDKIKKLIAEKGELIDAYRLPEGTFPTTKVGTDIILMRSWEKEKKELQKNWDDDSFTISEALIAEQKGHADLLSDNLWFKQHPEKILGEVKTRTNRFGKVEEYVAVHEGLTVQDELNKIDGMLPKVEKPELKTYYTLKEEDVKNLEIISDDDFSDIVDSIILNDYKNIPNAIRLPNIKAELAEKLGLEKDSAFILKKSATHIRPDRKGSYGQAFDTEEYRQIPQVLRNADFAVVDNVFQNFQIIFDDVNDDEKINKLIFNKDKLGNYLVTIGKVDRESAFSEERNAVVAVGVAPTIQTLRTRASSTALRASTTTVDSNIAQNKNMSTENEISSRPKKEKWNIQKSKGEVMTAQEFSHLYGKDFDEREFPIWRATDWQGNIELSKLTQDDLHYLSESGKYVEKNIGKWTHRVLFTSGDIYKKIEEQKQYLEKSGGNRLFEENIRILESVKKPLIDMNHIHFGLRTTLAEEFTTTHIDSEGNTVELNLQESFILWAQNTSLANQKWRKDIDFTTANITREELGGEITFDDIVDYIDGTPVKAEAVRGWRTYNMSEEEKKAEKSERRKEADLKRQVRSDIANALFDRFLHEGLGKADSIELEAEYNRRFNSYIIPDYSKLPLFVEGMSAYKGDSKFRLYDQQIKGISFLCNKGNGLLAYDVGVGKTAAGIVATVNQIQTGRSTRPLIVVPNQVYAKWYTDIKQLFPNIKVNDLYNFNKDSVGKYVDKTNPHKLNIPENSISLCTYEALKNITFTDESCENALYEDFANLLSADFDGTERANAESSDKIKGIIGSASHVKDSSYYYFEECGFDNLTVDEAHNFKNLWVVPRPKKKGESNEYSGIPSGKPSARALKMYGMTQLVQRNNDNRNVFMLTATPFTNSPTEVYSMLSYIGRERLREAGLSSLRSFFDEFAQTKQELGVTSAGNIDTKQVMKNWKELPALQSILTEFIDKVDGEEAGIIRPNKFTHVKPLDMSELQKQMREIDEERMAEIKEGNSAAIIVAMNNMRLSCVAPALANPDMYPGIELPPLSQLVETSPKLKFVCDAVIDMYKDNPDKGQFMYVPLGKESHGLIKDYLVAHGIPKDAVEIINGEINNTPEKKEKITGKFNDEKNSLKIIIGGRNTAEGIDLNGNSFVMYNCSLGWNPSETIQAEGRIWRQGNLQGNVHIVYPVMNDSIDSVLYQKHDEKRSRINELWNYKGDALNVEDINPEDLKLDLIKDPQKKAKLILQEETKEVRAELSRVNLKIKSFDEIIEKKKQLSLDFNSAKERIEYQKNEIEAYKERGLEIPEWQKLTLKNCNKDFSKAESGLSKVNEKLSSMNISIQEEQEEYIHRLNSQKHVCEEKIQHIKETLPQVLEKLRIEQMEQKLVEYPVSKQREILEADILNNLRPMKEVEYEIKTMRHETMLTEKLKAGDITQGEYDLYKNAGYEKYEQFMNGEIELPEEHQNIHLFPVENSKTKNFDGNIPSQTGQTKATGHAVSISGDELGLFFGISEEELFVKAPENDLKNSPGQSEAQKSDEITDKATDKVNAVLKPTVNQETNQNTSKAYTDSHISFTGLTKPKVHERAVER